ncbi:MAG: hypothetical protein IJG02_07455 [Thermoguttaceae bacterium]|nr:hypothetical protein [Thermoguttaceae bacterium]
MDIDVPFRQQLSSLIGNSEFERWFSGIRFAQEEGKLRVISSEEHKLYWIRKNYLSKIRQVGQSIFEEPSFAVELEKQPAPVSGLLFDAEGIDAEADDADLTGIELSSESIRTVRRPDNPPAKPARPRKRAAVPLPNWGSLDSFVVGLSNRIARSMIDIVINAPGERFNPLYISGPTSVGKTHLLEGVYTSFRAQNSRRTPLFMRSDQFTAIFTQSVRPGGDRRSFLDRFKNISLFVLDDIHFLEGKLKTQYELITLMDQLRHRGVQMIFGADRPISELTGLQSNLVSRLQEGVTCAIQPAEREILLEIFKRACARIHLPVSDEVARVVVSRYATHARQLFGIANQLCARYLTDGQPITVDTVEEILGPFGVKRRIVRLEDIEKAVAEMFEVKPSSLRGKSRARDCCYPRMLAMWLARKHTRSALSEIGRYFGNRSHSTVLSAQKRVDQWLSQVESRAAGADQTQYQTVENLRRRERVLLG